MALEKLGIPEEMVDLVSHFMKIRTKAKVRADGELLEEIVKVV